MNDREKLIDIRDQINAHLTPAPVPVDCVLSSWGPWGPCVGGQQTRTRTIVTQPANGGTACGPLTETQACVVEPAPTGLIPLKSTQIVHTQDNWKADFVPADKIAARTNMPWNVFADPAKKILAHPMNGVKPTRIQAWPHTGVSPGLYSKVPHMDGNISEPYNPEIAVGNHDHLHYNTDDLRSRPPHSGPRGYAEVSPFCIVLDHPPTTPDGTVIPRAPTWIPIRHDGWIQFIMPDGSLVDVGQIPGVFVLRDACVDEHDRVFMLGCDLGTWVPATDSWSGARIVRIDRTLGKGSATSPEDASKYVVTTEIGGLKQPVAICSVPDGTVYAADADPGVILEKKLGQVATQWLPFPGIRTLRYNAGKLYCSDNFNRVFIIDVATKVVGSNLMPSQYVGGPTEFNGRFYTLSVDVNGTFGPVGDIAISKSGGGAGNLEAWLIPADGSTVRYGNGIYGSGLAKRQVGDVKNVPEWYGHYNWLYQHHRWQGIMVCCGFSNLMMTIAANPPTPAEDPSFDFYHICSRGSMLIRKGAGKLATEHAVPSFTCLVSREGFSPFKGCSFDEMAERPFDETEAFIQRGMIGSYLRNFSGTDLWVIMAYIYTGSMRSIREGKALTDAIKAWWIAKYGPVPFADGADSPVIVDSEKYLEARQVNGVISVAVYDLWGHVLSTPLPAYQVIVDEGQPGEFIYTGSLPAGLHALTVKAAGFGQRVTIVTG